MEILKIYALVEDKNKSRLDSSLTTLKNKSKNLVSPMNKASGNDG